MNAAKKIRVGRRLAAVTLSAIAAVGTAAVGDIQTASAAGTSIHCVVSAGPITKVGMVISGVATTTCDAPVAVLSTTMHLFQAKPGFAYKLVGSDVAGGPDTWHATVHAAVRCTAAQTPYSWYYTVTATAVPFGGVGGVLPTTASAVYRLTC